MALALAKGFISSQSLEPQQIWASAPSDRNLVVWRQELNCHTTNDNSEVFKKCDIIFLSTKPHIFPKMMNEVKDSLTAIENESKLYVSVMAGIQMETLSGYLKTIAASPRVIRVHPNTPALVGAGCSVFTAGEGVSKYNYSFCEENTRFCFTGSTDADCQVVRRLLQSVGLCEMVPEYQQDAFTGMAGSGPAYIYTIIEALSDGGVRMGLPRDLATRFAAQMTMGAAKMVLETGMFGSY